MSSIEIQQAFLSTSGAGSMFMRQMREPVLLGCMLAGLGTSSAHAAPPNPVRVPQRSVEQTVSGARVVGTQTPGAAIGELRRLSGLTWEQLARMFRVSRRSLHFWASGKPMAPSHEEQLQRVLAVIREIDRGAASLNRTALLAVREDGVIPLDLLETGDFDRALSLLGPGGAQRFVPPEMSPEARAARAPRPPAELVGALQDRIHQESGALRAAKSVRLRSGD